AGALLVGSFRAPIEGLLVARRQGLLPAVLDHVVVEGDSALIILHGVDHANVRRDAGELQALPERKREALLVPGGDQDLELEPAAGRAVAQLGPLELVAGGREERECMTQDGPVATAGVAHWQRPPALEDVGTHAVGVWRDQGALARIGRPAIGR